MKGKQEDKKVSKKSISMPNWLWDKVDAARDGDTLSGTLQSLVKKALKIKK